MRLQRTGMTETGRALATAPALSATVEGWTAELAAGGVRPRTVETYRREVERVGRFIAGPEATTADMTADAILRYQARRPGLRPATLRKTISAVRSWARWAISRGLIPGDPLAGVPLPKKSRPLPRALSAGELAILEDYLRRPLGRPQTARRDVVLILLCLYAGLRIAEARDLDWSDVDGDLSALYVMEGKGGKTRMVPVHPRLRDELAIVPPASRRGPILAGPAGKRMSLKSLPHVFERRLPLAGLDISAHRLRHTFATRCLRAGATVRDVQLLLGHASIATTEIYLRVESPELRAAIARLPSSF